MNDNVIDKAPTDSDDDRPAALQRALEGALGVPFTFGNRIDVLRNGREIFPAMLAAVEAAQETIDLLTFVYWQGAIAQRFAEALAGQARAGVRVRVLLDAVGAARMKRECLDVMTRAGVEVEWFRPPVRWRVWQTDNRTHRKVLVCDRRVGFTGGVGIAQEWEGDARHPGEWRETHFRIEGPAVHGLHAAFLGNWAEAGRREYEDLDSMPALADCGDARLQVVRSTAAIGWSDVATVLRAVLKVAQRRLRITSPYFVPDPVLAALLAATAARGVRVEVLVPGPHHDQRVSQLATQDDFRQLLDAGIRIYRYQPTMLHAKVVSVDGELACVGSANFNQRSMRKDDEICVQVLHRPTVQRLDLQFEADLERSLPLDLREWRRRGPLQRLGELLVRPIRHQT